MVTAAEIIFDHFVVISVCLQFTVYIIWMAEDCIQTS